ncbi:MAG: FKBP-type peptidyl-prolyl cis-trans isomerase [Solirubrobacteraceae bacterium]
MNLRIPATAAAALLAAGALAACGDDSKSSTSGTAAAGTATAAGAAKAPAIPFPSGPAPKRLVVKDLKTGTGAVAKPGDLVTVNYVGASLSTKKVFDQSFGKEPFIFGLGASQVIKGWDQGVAGMKVGGRRLLVIPPALGYGASGQPPSIKPNETLVFVVDLLGVQSS